MRAFLLGLAAVLVVGHTTSAEGSGHARSLGVFTRDDDIGTVRQTGGATFDARSGTYRVIGNGGDLWAARDDFHFVHRRGTGDVTIAASIAQVGGSAEPHSKAGLMIRRDLTPGSPYADVVVHQNGLVALQYRATPGGDTFEMQVPDAGFGRFELERRGDEVSVAVADAAGRLHRVGGVRLKLDGLYHIGLLVCSHSDTRTKTVNFSDVRIGTATAMAAGAGLTPGHIDGAHA